MLDGKNIIFFIIYLVAFKIFTIEYSYIIILLNNGLFTKKEVIMKNNNTIFNKKNITTAIEYLLLDEL